VGLCFLGGGVFGGGGGGIGGRKWAPSTTTTRGLKLGNNKVQLFLVFVMLLDQVN
jgi:hypothetical protein